MMDDTTRMVYEGWGTRALQEYSVRESMEGILTEGAKRLVRQHLGLKQKEGRSYYKHKSNAELEKDPLSYKLHYRLREGKWYAEDNAKVVDCLEWGRKNGLFEVLSAKSGKKLHILTNPGNGYIHWPQQDALEACILSVPDNKHWAESPLVDSKPGWLHVWDDKVLTVFKRWKEGSVELGLTDDNCFCMRRLDLQDAESYTFGKQLLSGGDRADNYRALQELTGMPVALFERGGQKAGVEEVIISKLADHLESLHAAVANIREVRKELKAYREAGGTPDAFVGTVGKRAKETLADKAALWAAGGIEGMDREEESFGWRSGLKEMAQAYLDGKL